MKKFFTNTRALVTSAMLAGIAGVLMYFDFPVPFLPSFYKIDFSELPVLIGAYAFGPIAGVIIEPIKILIKVLLKGSHSLGIGELANLLTGLAFILPASVAYHFNKTKKSAVVGLAIGTVTCTIVGCMLNAYILLPAYAAAYGGMDKIIGLGTKVNKNISGLTSFILFATAPLNLIKCIAVSIITLLVYKPLRRIIRSSGEK